MNRSSIWTLLVATTGLAILIGGPNSFAADHTTMNECLDYTGKQCDRDNDSYPGYADCIDFGISECEDTYLPAPSSKLTATQTTQVKRDKAMVQSFRAKALRDGKAKKSSR